MTRSRSIPTPNSTTDGKIVIGIDPGLARTGIGVIVKDGLSLRCVHHSVVRTSPRQPLAERLAAISAAVTEACERHMPELGAIERTFINDNPASSLSLGQARGAALAALGRYGLPVVELAPNTIKLQVTGDRLASKQQVATMVRSILDVDQRAKLSTDASDALAIAISCTPKRQLLLRTRRRRRPRGR